MAAPTTRPPVIDLTLERIKSISEREAVWQLGFARMPGWVTGEGGNPYRPVVGLCRDAAGGPVGNGGPITPGDPLAPAALEAIAKLATHKGVGFRPSRLEVRDPALADALRASLEGSGIEVAVVERLDAIDEVMADMHRHFGGAPASTRLFAPELELDRLRAFAEAAAEFYRAAPWNQLTDEDLVHVAADRIPEGLGHFNVLGAGGIEHGLAFYRSRADFERFHRDESPQVYLASTRHWLFSFDEIMDWPFADSELWEDHALPVADPEGYPSLVCHAGRDGLRPADAEHLTFAEALLRALASTTEDELDSGRWRKSVTTFGGDLTLEFSIPALLDEAPKSRRRATRDSATPPDRRLLERTLVDLQRQMAEQEFGSLDEAKAFLATKIDKAPARRAASTPAEQAQELVYRALEAHGRMRIKLAREALKLWPDCAEAWTVRAEAMPDLGRRAELFQQAVAAAERTLGQEPFAQDVGHFWGILATRPYMRARNGLANALWESGQRDEAIRHWHELLRLNPSDNQGVRHVLVPRLLEQRRDDEASSVLAAFEEDTSAMLSYARVLVEFRLSGDSDRARELLQAALRGNPHVLKYLAGSAAMPTSLPELYRPGSDDEAVLTTAVLALAWQEAEGAIEWLKRARKLRKKEREQRRRPTQRPR